MTKRKDVIRREWVKKVKYCDDYGIDIIYYDYPDKDNEPSTIRGEIILWTDEDLSAESEIIGYLPENSTEIPEKVKREMYKLAEYFESADFDVFKGRVKVYEKICVI